MSGLYNVLFGQNNAAPVILAALGLTPADTGRFRDAYVERLGNTTDYRIVIHTRNGGGNREDYEDTNAALAAHPFYQGDEDDSFDRTYADFYFALPPEYADELKAIADQQQYEKPSEKWQKLLTNLKSESPA